MKNKIQKILVVMITIIVLSTSNTQARESYAKEGAVGGAVGVGLVFGLFGAAMSDFCPGADSCPNNPSAVESFLVGGLIGGAIGGAVGGLIGFAIPKHTNVSITPTFDPTPGAVGGGVNLSLNF